MLLDEVEEVEDTVVPPGGNWVGNVGSTTVTVVVVKMPVVEPGPVGLPVPVDPAPVSVPESVPKSVVSVSAMTGTKWELSRTSMRLRPNFLGAMVVCD